jgi:carbamoyltransferase
VNNSKNYVIGTGLSHDGSVCLLADGKIVMAIEKERLTRSKHDGGNDKIPMQYVLDRAGITLDDVALVVQNENMGMFYGGNTEYRGGERMIGESTPVVTISHHLAHAYSALGPSGFDECAVLVVDGCGNSYEDCIDITSGSLVQRVPHDLEYAYYEKDSYYRGQGGGLEAVAKDFSPWGGNNGWPVSPPATMHSIGGLYQTFSKYVFGDFSDSGKLMGLSPYGKPGRFDFPIFELEDGQVLVRREALRDFRSPAKSRDALKSNFGYYADLACWVQREIERALLYLVRDRLERWPSRRLAYAGGVALNAVANSRILRETGIERMFIQPAAGDNGLAIGCAYYGWLQVLKRRQVHDTGTTYLGASYPADRVRSAVAAARDKVKIEEETDAVNRTARLLADGKVVGWYRGGAEFGPRALGHRSVLAHPGIPGLRDHINANVKFREDFRPFAPSVLAHQASRCFDCGDHQSPYMILVFNVLPQWRERLINVVHEDDSSRLHTVTRESEPVYFRLLEEFEKLTGLPVLLNTSLNKRGMPIVETPEEAVALFLECALDVLVLDDLVITKPEVDQGTTERVRGLIDRPRERDIPLIGLRLASLSVGYALDHTVPGGSLDGTGDEITLKFNDTPQTLAVPQSVVDLLRQCDGVRAYAEIAEILKVSLPDVLRTAATMSQRGILDHVARRSDYGATG